MASTLCYLGDFDSSRQYAMSGLQIWRSDRTKSPVEEIIAPPISCLIYEALSEWYLGEIASSQMNRSEAISVAKELNDMSSLAVALYLAAALASFERNPTDVDRLTSDLIELSTRYNFAFWVPGANVLRGWARSVLGDTAEGVSLIERGVEDYRATGSIAGMPMFLTLKAEALYLADRTSEALETISEAEALAERFEVGWWYAKLRCLRGVLLAALGTDDTRTETSFREAIRIAKEQKAISVMKCAEASYAEYRRQKASGSEGHGFRLPTWSSAGDIEGFLIIVSSID